jgi:hypothetical protein
MEHNPRRADPVADRERVLERGERLSADLALAARGIDQVDRVDHHHLERRGVHRLTKGGEVLLGIGGRPPGARALMEDLDRLGAGLDAALDRPVQPAGCGNMRADQHV